MGSFVAVCGLLSSCGLRVFSSLVVAHGLCSCGMWAVVEAHELSSCGIWAPLPHGLWDLSSLTRDWTLIPCTVRWLLYHWTAREVPMLSLCKFPKAAVPFKLSFFAALCVQRSPSLVFSVLLPQMAHVGLCPARVKREWTGSSSSLSPIPPTMWVQSARPRSQYVFTLPHMLGC